MVFHQDEVLNKLESFLGMPMAKIEMLPDSVGRWKTDEGAHMFDAFKKDLLECGYLAETARIRAAAKGIFSPGGA